MVSSGLPRSFWGKAVMTACHIVNLTPSAALNDRTPFEMWNNMPADYSSLRTFGCSAYSHQNEGKLEPRAQKCVFLGYPQGVKGYRLWARGHGRVKVIISRDVTFNENEMPCLDPKAVNDRHEKKDDFFLTIADNDLEKPNHHSEIEVESDNNQAQTGLEEFVDISPESAIEQDLPVSDDSNLRDY
ncbi:Retrovirus-related Pol polyprotein from transposon TNT 1-94 [Abeliophyllum distichum]|uniref:Retrovirus-related Pol polyprotein from transposon TNT 1-94 n=1 Tax=Abeliophyllum distichum TaxID=126358 RepID=A0ABD1TK36_9LAMI